MTIGPQLIYKCPHCGNLLQKSSVSSNNNFISGIFPPQDEATVIDPTNTFITECKKCNSLFSLTEVNQIGKYRWEYDRNSEIPVMVVLYANKGSDWETIHIQEWQEADVLETLTIPNSFKKD